MKANASVFIVALREELEEEIDFVFLGGLEDCGCIGIHLQMPRMNSASERSLVSSQSNYLKSLSPQYPFLWKKSRKF